MVDWNLYKMGGIAALIAAATFVVGMVLAVTLLAAYTTGDLEPAQSAAFLADNQGVMYAWYLTIYVVFGGVLVVLVLALYQRLVAGSPALAQSATRLG